jgi:hypothetical protein
MPTCPRHHTREGVIAEPANMCGNQVQETFDGPYILVSELI